MYKVMIVEDDTVLQYIYKSMKTWSDCGFLITAVESNGRAALDRLKKEKFDLIFTDIRMPLVDGVELLKQIKSEDDPTPVVFASSYSEFEYAKQGIVYGVFDYLLKPVEEKKLAEVLERAKKVIDEHHETKISHVMENLLDDLEVSPYDDEFVKHIAVYCSEHYKDDLSAEELSSFMGFRKDYFGKLFKQHFGVLYSNFRAQVKVAFAIALLTTGNYKAYEVSDMLGYQSYKYFSEKFKKITGFVPTEYKPGTGGKK